MTDSAGLSGKSATVYVDDNVVFVGSRSEFERLLNDILLSVELKVLVDGKFIDNYSVLSTGDKSDAGDCLLSSSYSPKLYFLYFFLRDFSPLT